jgi:hypothetical protein
MANEPRQQGAKAKGGWPFLLIVVLARFEFLVTRAAACRAIGCAHRTPSPGLKGPRRLAHRLPLWPPFGLASVHPLHDTLRAL